jgi:flagellar assembly factor FliW
VSELQYDENGRIRVESQQLGVFEVPREQVLHLPDGIFGFGQVHYYCLLDVREGSRFRLLQSIEKADLAFVVIDPQQLDPAYPIEEIAELARPPLDADEGVGVACIATVRPPPTGVTVNLAAPLVMGVETRMGVQVVINRYSIRQSLA